MREPDAEEHRPAPALSGGGPGPASAPSAAVPRRSPRRRAPSAPALSEAELGLPDAAELAALLGEDWGLPVALRVEAGLVATARELVARPSKLRRGRLLRLGYELAAGRGAP